MREKDFFEYKGYIGSIEYSEADKVLFGKVFGIRSLISYEGETLEDLEADFRGAVDDYFELCKEQNMKPETTPLSMEELE